MLTLSSYIIIIIHWDCIDAINLMNLCWEEGKGLEVGAGRMWRRYRDKLTLKWKIFLKFIMYVCLPYMMAN